MNRKVCTNQDDSFVNDTHHKKVSKNSSLSLWPGSDFLNSLISDFTSEMHNEEIDIINKTNVPGCHGMIFNAELQANQPMKLKNLLYKDTIIIVMNLISLFPCIEPLTKLIQTQMANLLVCIQAILAKNSIENAYLNLIEMAEKF